MCHNDKETFNHVWTCDQHLSHIQRIIYNQKKALIQLVKEYTNGNKLFSFVDLVHPTLWSISYSSTDFTFIDIIKGIVPAFLFRQINKYVNNTLLTQQILSIFLNRIYLDIMHLIWKPRCDEIIRLEKHYNIDKKQKKKKKQKGTKGISKNRFNVDNSSFFSDQEGLEFSIRCGGDWSDFTVCLNYLIRYFGKLLQRHDF